ncbi:MAG: PAS domain S-box protein [Methanobacterium sp.]
MAKEDNKQKFETEHMYRTLFESIEDAFQLVELIYDSKGKVHDFRYLKTNQAFERQSGLKSSEIMGKTVREVMPNVKHYYFEMYEKAANEGKPLREENYNQNDNRWYDMHYVPYSKNKIGVLFRDITERKKVEKQLKESEERYRNIIETANEGIMIANTSGVITFTNAKMAEMLGYKIEELIGIEGASLVDPLEHRKALEKIKEREKGIKDEYELKFLKKDGEELWTLVSGTPIYDNDGVHISNMAMYIDITERKKAEKELKQVHDHLEEQVQERTVELEEAYKSLKESELKFKTLAENSPDIIIRYDTNLKILYINQDLQVMDTSKESFIGKTPADLGMNPENTRMWIKNLTKALKTGENQWMEYQLPGIEEMRTFSSTITPEFDEEGQISSLLVISRDITARKQAEQKLKKSEKRLAEAQKMAHLGNWEWNITTNELYWSDEIYRIFGRQPQEFGATYDAFLSYVHHEDRDYVDNKVNEALTGKSYNIDHKIITADGRERIVYEEAEVTFDSENNPIIMVGTVQDVTDQRIVEKLLKETIKELKRSNDELQSFAYITSHDLQEPLRTIASYAQLLKRRYQGQLDSDADEFINYMVSGSKRMKQQIQGLLDYSRVGTKGHKFKEFDSASAFSDALSSLQSAIVESKAEISVNKLPIINADEDQIVRVFQNLIGNAIKFRKDDEQLKIHVSAKKEGIEYVFSVSDNGIGLEEEYSDRIFEVFKRLHAIGKYEGAGIGLAIVKRIIDRHKGRIWVESKLGKGSTFYFALPINHVE